MLYEYKTIKIALKKSIFSSEFIPGSEIDIHTEKYGRIGWELFSTSVVHLNGSSRFMYLFFRKPLKNIEELV